jgi:hypothetical protein
MSKLATILSFYFSPQYDSINIEPQEHSTTHHIHTTHIHTTHVHEHIPWWHCHLYSPPTTTIINNYNNISSSSSTSRRVNAVPEIEEEEDKKENKKENDDTTNNIIFLVGCSILSFVGIYTVANDGYITYKLSGVHDEMKLHKHKLLLYNAYQTWRSTYLKRTKSIFGAKIALLISIFSCLGGGVYNKPPPLYAGIILGTISGGYWFWKYLTGDFAFRQEQTKYKKLFELCNHVE